MKNTMCRNIVVLVFVFFALSSYFSNANAQTKNVSIYLSPSSGSFTEGASFDLDILVNTRGQSINTVDLTINFDPKKVMVIKPAGIKSIIGSWVAPPTYDNTAGFIRLSGIIPNGITTSSGLIGTITRKPIATGEITVSVGKDSQILLNDGLGTKVDFEAERGIYSLVPRISGGIDVYSETHPLQSTWYNNNSPVFKWQKSNEFQGYSYVLDTKPFTNPDNTITATDTSKTYIDIPDGDSYFHIKALKNGAWTAPTHYRVRIDTTPPLPFKPKANFILAAIVSRSLIYFETKDTLSQIDHYEVGVIDKADASTKSPVFVESESPYQLPFTSINKALVMVRAFDGAGNVREESLNISRPFALQKFFGDNLVGILLLLLIILILLILVHYFVGHHIIRHAKRIWAYIKKAEAEENRADDKEDKNTSV